MDFIVSRAKGLFQYGDLSEDTRNKIKLLSFISEAARDYKFWCFGWSLCLWTAYSYFHVMTLFRRVWDSGL